MGLCMKSGSMDIDFTLLKKLRHISLDNHRTKLNRFELSTNFLETLHLEAVITITKEHLLKLLETPSLRTVVLKFLPIFDEEVIQAMFRLKKVGICSISKMFLGNLTNWLQKYSHEVVETLFMSYWLR